MPIVNPTLPNDGEDADAVDVSAPILAILAVLNGHLDVDNIEPNSLPWSIMASFTDSIPGNAIQVDSQLKLYRDDINTNYVVSGAEWSTLSGLNGAMTTGVIHHPNGDRSLPAAIATKAFTASKDTYVDIGTTGSPTYNEVANGATAPSVGTNSVRVAKVVTNGSAITSVTNIGRLRRVTVLRQNDTTNAYQESIILTGWGAITYSGATPIANETVTFGLQFASIPIVLITHGGDQASGTVALGNGGNLVHGTTGAKATAVTLAQFVAYVFQTAGSNYANGNIGYYHWAAFGEVV